MSELHVRASLHVNSDDRKRAESGDPQHCGIDRNTVVAGSPDQNIKPGDDTVAKRREDAMHRIVRGLAFGVALGAATAIHAQDANYPNRPVRIIVPFAAGGPPDVISRLVAQKLSERWRQQVYVENLPGAGGNTGTATAARAVPDGYTLYMMSTGFMVNPSLYAKVPYDPIKDFAPVTLAAVSPNVLFVHPSVPAHSVKELIDLIKSSPGTYSYAQPSTGSTPHLSGELLKLQYGLDLVTVPFNGASLAVNSTLAATRRSHSRHCRRRSPTSRRATCARLP